MYLFRPFQSAQIVRKTVCKPGNYWPNGTVGNKVGGTLARLIYSLSMSPIFFSPLLPEPSPFTISTGCVRWPTGFFHPVGEDSLYHSSHVHPLKRLLGKKEKKMDE